MHSYATSRSHGRCQCSSALTSCSGSQPLIRSSAQKHEDHCHDRLIRGLRLRCAIALHRSRGSANVRCFEQGNARGRHQSAS